MPDALDRRGVTRGLRLCDRHRGGCVACADCNIQSIGGGIASPYDFDGFSHDGAFRSVRV
jgi:hypothetical protein